MIVDPDFCDHWKTRMLVDLLDGDEMAPVYILRIWSHCQNRRQCCFDISSKALKAICRFTGDADEFELAMSESGFLERTDDGDLLVCGWEEYNKSIVANWKNGKKGGRPKAETETHSKPNGNPSETQRKPIDNPTETHSKPIDNPNSEWGNQLETVRLGEDRLGEVEDRLGIISCPESPAEDSGPDEVLTEYTFATKKRDETWTMPQKLLDLLKETYPYTDVETEIRKAKAWCYSNKAARKTSAGMPKFINNWINKADGKSNQRSSDSPAQRTARNALAALEEME